MMRKIQMEGSRIDEMEESPHCTGLDTITRERYKQKITTYAGRDPCVMKRSDFSTKLKSRWWILTKQLSLIAESDKLFRFHLYEGCGICVTLKTLLQQHVQGMWPLVLLAARKTKLLFKF